MSVSPWVGGEALGSALDGAGAHSPLARFGNQLQPGRAQGARLHIFERTISTSDHAGGARGWVWWNLPMIRRAHEATHSSVGLEGWFQPMAGGRTASSEGRTGGVLGGLQTQFEKPSDPRCDSRLHVLWRHVVRRFVALIVVLIVRRYLVA